MRSPYRFTLLGVAALALAAAGCSASSTSTSSGGTNWATVTSAAAGGGMSKLVAAAKKEGTLNVIALPPTWANYGAIIKDFEAKYGIKVSSALPDGTSQQEVNVVKQDNGTAAAPDVLDVGVAVALANTSLFAPYKVSTWADIPRPRRTRTLAGTTTTAATWRSATRANSARSPHSASCSARSSRMRSR